MLLLQRADNPLIWENVDSDVFDAWEKVLNKDVPRYNGNRFAHTENGIEIYGKNLKASDFIVVCKKLELDSQEEGTIQSPEFVKMKKGRKVVIHEMFATKLEKLVEPIEPTVEQNEIS